MAMASEQIATIPEWEHPARAAALAELHARPAPRVDPAGHVTRLVYALDESRPRTAVRRIDIICKAAGVAPPSPQARYHSIMIEGRELRWERHTEFVSYTFVSPGDGRTELIWQRLTNDPEVQAIAGPLAARIAIAVKPMSPDDRVPDGPDVCSSLVMGGLARISTDFHADPHGFVRFEVAHADMSSDQLGTLCQRILEIESYRMIALMSLPLARQTGTLVQQLEAELGEVTKRIEGHQAQSSSEPLFVDLTKLAARVEAELASASFRFSAALAYGAIVEDRVRVLDERADGARPMVGAFLMTRLTPAMRTCSSMQKALADLASRCARAADLIRTRIDLELARQNNALLEALNQRTRLQTRMQQTVEGLSVAAISYYVLGLAGYPIKGAKDAGFWPYDVGLTLALLVPVVIFGIYLAIRRVRRLHSDQP
ncbi:MAG: DUF3422 domain-containing protein [Beijerinckiaceae bacterium]|nr:DUF3422 domain-containing protein [Beijerinckiaceae bacterium]